MSRPDAGAKSAAIGTRRVLALALPNVLANLTQPVVGIVATAIAGHMAGAANLAAVALGSAFLNLVFWNFAFLKKTTASVTAQAFGAGDRQEQSDTLWRMLGLALVAGLVLFAIAPLAAGSGLALLGGEADVQAVAATYVTVRLAGAALVFGNSAALGYLLGIQRSGLALIAQSAATLVHVSLPLLLVFGLGWGIAGLALAAIAGDAVGFGAGALFAAATGFGPPRRSVLRVTPLRALVAANLDMFARSLSLTFAFAWFTRAGAREGTVVLAANALLLNFQTLLSLVVEGFAAAGQSLVGAACGARNPAMVRDVFRITGQWTTGLALVYAAGYALWGDTLVLALTDQPDIAAAAARYLPWLVIAPLVMAWAFLLDGLMLGATRTRDLRNSMVASVACFLVAATGLQPLLGNHGLWIGWVVMMATRAGTLGWALKQRPLHAGLHDRLGPPASLAAAPSR